MAVFCIPNASFWPNHFCWSLHNNTFPHKISETLQDKPDLPKLIAKCLCSKTQNTDEPHEHTEINQIIKRSNKISIRIKCATFEIIECHMNWIHRNEIKNGIGQIA